MGKRLYLFGSIGLAILLISIKGTNTTDLFASMSAATLEETITSMNSSVPPSQLMDMNMLSGHGPNTYGGSSDLNTFQGSYLLPRSGVLTILFDGVDQRTDVTKYEVLEGDVMSSIAEDYGISLQTLISANNISNIDAISPGIILKIPPINGILHTVKQGDSVSFLAKKYDAEQDKIISFNGLPLSGDLQIGEELIIPGGKMPSSVPTRTISGSQRFAGLPKFEGFFITPATCRISQRAHLRNGYDCAAATGTPVYAAASGIVNFAKNGWNGGYGSYVRISHSNGLETLYGHLSKIYAVSGETVEQGEIIGLIGNTGQSTGPHVHFEVHGAINPLSKYRLGGQVLAKK